MAVIIFASALTVPAWCGGMDAGGGHGLGSSREEVMEALDKLPLALDLYFRRMNSTGLLDPKNIKDENLKKVVEKYLPDTSSSKKILEPIKFNIQESLPCNSEHGPSDASTKFQQGAEICFSIPSIMRFPKSTLNYTLASLLVHELAHQKGANEAEAVMLQKYFFQKLEISNLFSVAEKGLKTYLQQLQKNEMDISHSQRKIIYLAQDICSDGKKFSEDAWSLLRKELDFDKIPNEKLEKMLPYDYRVTAFFRNLSWSFSIITCSMDGNIYDDKEKIDSLNKMIDYILDLALEHSNKLPSEESAKKMQKQIQRESEPDMPGVATKAD